MMSSAVLKFCTYLKRIEKFKYESETYDIYTFFCVKNGSFVYQIGDEKQETAREGEIIVCPPNRAFFRKIIEPTELCMIQFCLEDGLSLDSGKIKVSNIIRFNDDMEKLEDCLFYKNLSKEPRYFHYCMDIIYIAMDNIKGSSGLNSVKQYIEQNFDKDININDIAKDAGYTTPYLIYKFKSHYGLPPKAYHSNIRLQKAKELLITTDMLSNEVAKAVGFSDELYFIRFFKKYTGLTPKQFMKQNIL